MKRQFDIPTDDGVVWTWTLGLVLTVLGAGMGIIMLAALIDHGEVLISLIGMVPSVGLVLVGWMRLLRAIRLTVSKRAFHVAEVVTVSPAVPVGGTAVLKLCLTPKRPLSISGAQAEIHCRETAYRSSGKNTRAYIKRIFEQKVDIPMPSQVGTPFEHELSIVLPAHVPPTWKGRSNSLTTHCEIHVKIDRYPDLLLAQEIVVVSEVEA